MSILAQSTKKASKNQVAPKLKMTSPCLFFHGVIMACQCPIERHSIMQPHFTNWANNQFDQGRVNSSIDQRDMAGKRGQNDAGNHSSRTPETIVESTSVLDVVLCVTSKNLIPK
jgi:hypothetical protein